MKMQWFYMLFWKKLLFGLGFSLIFSAMMLFSSPAKAFAADFGFNLWNLTNLPADQIHTILANLGDSCKTTIVRIWGYQFTNGIDGLNNLQKVFDNAPPNIKFIVALEDFPFGPPEADPGAWFGGGYRQSDDGGVHPSYRTYVQQVVSKYRGKVFMWELMNEPQCKFDTSCYPKLVAWARDISNLIRANDSTALISAGMIGDNIEAQQYEAVTSLPNITANSCHFYNKDGPETQCNTPKAIVKGKGKYFYVGEAGYALDSCDGDVLKARASYFKQKQQDFDPDAFLIWQFQTEGAGDQFSVESTLDPICTGETGNIPPGACTGAGRSSKISALYGRDPYNRIKTGARYFPWTNPYCPAIASDQWIKDFNTEDFKMCTNDNSKEGVMSCPDYSPNRPYPGDTCLDFLDTHNDSESDLVKYEMEDFPIGEEQTLTFCSAFSGTCGPDTQIARTSGRNAVYFKKSFVDFLGTNNEYTSNPNYVMSLRNNIARTALFLTDFLGGMVDIPGVRGRSHEVKDYIDAYLEYQRTNDYPAFQAKIAAIPNLKENLQMTAGVIGKTMTDEAKKQERDPNETILTRWARNNLPHDLNAGKYKSDSDPTLMPVGDYVIAYKCADSPEVFLNEENFPDSLERRKATNSRTKASCGDRKIFPIRISDYVCSASHPDLWNQIETELGGVSKKGLCRGKELPENDPFDPKYNWNQQDLDVIKQYFLTATTREDVPVRVVLSCPSNGNPDNLRVATGSGELDEGEMRQAGVDKYALWTGVDANGIPQYDIVTRTYIYVGHLAEAREQTNKVDELLFPKAISDKKIVYTKESLLSEEKIADFDTNAAKAVTGNASAKGDLIAEDSMNRINELGDAWQYSGYELRRLVRANTAGWLAGDRTKDLTKNVSLTANCKVSVEIPYVQEVAARTIGKTHGFYRLFFPKDQQKIIDDYINSSENKGAAVASSQYSTLGGADRDEKLFIPWVSAMQTWNTFLNVGVNPLSLQTAVGAGSNDTENPYIGGNPDTPGDSCLTQGIDFKDPSYDSGKLTAMYVAFSQQYKSSALNRSDGKMLWDAAISTAVSKGLNPYLALAYWGEETNFSSPINPNPKKGLGCGIMGEKDPQGHRLSCIQTNTDNDHRQEFFDEFKCFTASNSYSCNLSSACLGQDSTFNFIGCYQYGAGNPPGATHLKNLMYFYHLLKGDTPPNCQ